MLIFNIIGDKISNLQHSFGTTCIETITNINQLQILYRPVWLLYIFINWHLDYILHFCAKQWLLNITIIIHLPLFCVNWFVLFKLMELNVAALCKSEQICFFYFVFLCLPAWWDSVFPGNHQQTAMYCVECVHGSVNSKGQYFCFLVISSTAFIIEKIPPAEI